MAAGATTEPVQESAERDYDRFILQQIERTQRQVKATELATLVLTLAVCVLGFFLLITIVDHWIVDLGFWGRTISLLLLVSGAIGFFTTKVVPYILRTINPIYAASAIEKSTPTVKNGLINFLLLRGRPQEVRSAVFDAVQKRAAVDLSNVEVDLAVDRTLTIRLGYAFAILVTIAGAYKIFSPKDPITTVARVITPWEQIARPSKVQIENVLPGDATVYRGQSVDITAAILGIDSDDPVSVVFSTENSQVVDATLAMKQDGGSRFIATLGGGTGLQQSTLYRVMAGDAESIEYRIDVKEAPSIDVTRVEYDYPRYTEIPAESTNVGDLRAVEGTKVTISAEANQPIASAYLELMPGTSPTTANENEKQFRTVRMQHSGSTATATFVLKLLPDRKTPEYVSYRVRFSNDDGQRNDQPVLHKVEVTPDLAPLVDILSPKTRDIEVPANRHVDFEIRGVDPDFKLKKLTIEAATGGHNILSKNLLEKNEAGQVIREYRFTPEKLALKPGMSVLVWAVAADNRHSPKTGQPDSNTIRTENYRVRILAPDRFPSEADQEENQDQQSKTNEQSDNGGQNGEGDSGGSGGLNSSDSSEGESENENQSGSGRETDSDQPGDPSDDTSDGEGTTSNQKSESGSNQDPQDPNNSRDQHSDGNESGSDSAEPSNGKSGENQSGSSNSAEGQPGDGDSNQPVASDGTNDPDAFERILDHMEENGEGPDTESSEQPGTNPSNDNSGSQHETNGANESSSTDGEASNDGPQENQQQDENNSTGPSGNSNKKPDDQQTNGEGGGSQSSESNTTDARTSDERSGDESNDSLTGNGSDRDKDDAGRDNPNKSREPKPQGDNPPGSDSQSGNDGEGQYASEPTDGTNGEPNSDDAQDPDKDTTSKPNPGQSDQPTPNGKPNASNSDGSSSKNESSSDASDQPNNSDPAESNNNSTQTDSGESSGTKTGDTESDAKPNSNQPAGGNDTSSAATNGDPTEVEGQDDPNLEYARKATDMAIEYLESKKKDPKLLEELGWTEADADAFLKRWRKLKQQSAAPGKSKQAKREWTDSLKSLGLKPKSKTTTESGDTRRRDIRNISSDSGSRPRPPKPYADQFRAYLKESETEQ